MKRQALCLVLALIFLEWLDFSLYLYLAKPVFSQQFFPRTNNSLMLTFALFATAYCARPIGGWLFGRRADSRGRRKPMIYSAALMGLATLGICLLPTYAQIGLWAAWGLLILRILQGLALGGEINTSAMFLIEHHPKKPVVIGSYVAASGALGMFTGGAIAAILQYLSLPEAWRLVFALVGGLSLWVCRLRKQLRESPEFKEPSQQEKVRWGAHYRGLLNIAAAGFFVSVIVYTCHVFWVSYAIDKHLMSKTLCAWLGACAQLLSAFLALPIAYYVKSSQAGRLMRASMIFGMISAPLLFYYTSQNNVFGSLLALGGYALANGLLCSTLFYFLYLQLPASCRCQGVSTVWAIAASIGTVTLPLSEHAMALGLTWFPGAMVSAAAILGLFLCREIPAEPNKSF